MGTKARANALPMPAWVQTIHKELMLIANQWWHNGGIIGEKTHTPGPLDFISLGIQAMNLSRCPTGVQLLVGRWPGLAGLATSLVMGLGAGGSIPFIVTERRHNTHTGGASSGCTGAAGSTSGGGTAASSKTCKM